MWIYLLSGTNAYNTSATKMYKHNVVIFDAEETGLVFVWQHCKTSYHSVSLALRYRGNLKDKKNLAQFFYRTQQYRVYQE